MSKIEVNAIEPQSGTTLTLGASGDTITIPAGATISNSGTAAGFGPTGAVSWNTTKITANPNPAVSGVGYFCDTTSAAFTVTLPSSPSAGAVIGIADYANTFATNNLTINRNGSNIGGLAVNPILATNGISVTFVYVDATQGWIVTDSGNRSDLPQAEYIVATGGTITTCGNYKIHTFTGPGTFTVSSAGNSQGSNSVDYLVVAGGASGGAGGGNGGGGGAGGLRASATTFSNVGPSAPLTSGVSALPVTATGYPITVGAGGAAIPGSVGNPAPVRSGNPGTSSIFSTITSAGGGGGGAINGNSTPGAAPGLAGGSGGGGGSWSASTNSGGAGNTPPVSPSQGNNGGAGQASGGESAGGGGGAMAVGGSGAPAPSPAGGIGGGFPNAFGTSGELYSGSYYFAGGGGGSNGSNSSPANAGGIGGGGRAALYPNISPSVAGTANTGGGGGGGLDAGIPTTDTGAAGGSGIVVIRYKFQ